MEKEMDSIKLIDPFFQLCAIQICECVTRFSAIDKNKAANGHIQLNLRQQMYKQHR